MYRGLPYHVLIDLFLYKWVIIVVVDFCERVDWCCMHCTAHGLLIQWERSRPCPAFSFRERGFTGHRPFIGCTLGICSSNVFIFIFLCLCYRTQTTLMLKQMGKSIATLKWFYTFDIRWLNWISFFFFFLNGETQINVQVIFHKIVKESQSPIVGLFKLMHSDIKHNVILITLI